MDGNLKVNERFQIDSYTDGDKGWIRFIGCNVSIKHPQQLYVGVEWDKSGRGKHEGQLPDGTYAFNCGKKKGSFVHPKRILSCNKLSTIISERYTTDYQSIPKDIIISNSGISTIDIMTPISHVVSLDISNNLLYSWENILQLLYIFPNLHTLNISYNFLSQCIDSALDSNVTDIQTLILNDVPNSWDFVTKLACSHKLPKQKVLHLGYIINHNNFLLNTHVKHSEVFTNLHTLSITHSQLDSIDKIGCFLQCPTIKYLYLSYNNIKTITNSDKYNDINSSIIHLSLYHNEISTLQELNCINKILPKLTEINLLDNPINIYYPLKKQKFSYIDNNIIRLLLVAHLPQINILNNTPITYSERITAQNVYVDHILQTLKQSIDDPVLFTLFPPIYEYINANKLLSTNLDKSNSTTSSLLLFNIIFIKKDNSIQKYLSSLQFTIHTTVKDVFLRILNILSLKIPWKNCSLLYLDTVETDSIEPPFTPILLKGLSIWYIHLTNLYSTLNDYGINSSGTFIIY